MKYTHTNTFSKPLAGFVILSLTLFQLSVGFLFTAKTAGAANNIFLVSGAESFESGNFGNWSYVDNDWSITSGSGHSGSKKAQVSDQGTNPDELRKNISTAGYTNINLSYWYRAGQALESHDHIYVEWWDGSAWHQLADHKSLAVGGWAYASYNLGSGANNNSNFKFRFKATGLEPSTGGGDRDRDEFQLDDVLLTGDIIPICGNQQIEGSETCDGNSQSCTTGEGYAGTESCNGQCSGWNSCVATEFCGDGQMNGPEVCEVNDIQPCVTGEGYAGNQGCLGDCSGWGECVSEEFCGDGIINDSEECDDGQINGIPYAPPYGQSGSYCSGYCTIVDVDGPYCGDGNIDQPEETCEGPGTSNNTSCGQSTTQCDGNKTQTRDEYGNCDGSCGCVEDGWDDSVCIKDSCGAVCAEDIDCDDQNENTDDTCNLTTCGCEYATICQDNTELDKADIGNTDSETYHPIFGWSAANIPGGYGGCQNGSVCTYRQILGAPGPDQCIEADRDATVVLHADTNTITTLKVKHLDGISLEDDFEIWIEGDPDVYVGEWIDDTQVQTEVWKYTDFDVSSLNLTGDIVIRLHATGTIWSGCPTWGQVAIDWLSLNGCGTPYDPFEPECITDNDCNDENACTTNTCEQGTCVSANVTCFDQDPCTDDSCDALSGCVFTPNEICVCDQDKELVSNNSFEEPIVTNPAKWDLFTSVSSWVINWVSSGTGDPKLELQRGVNGWLPFDGAQYAELDSTSPAKIYQDIATIPNYVYQVKFAFSPRPNTGAPDNQLEFSWNNVVEQVLSATNTTKNTIWTEHSYELEATDFTTRLQFADLGTSNSLGTFLDKVSVKCIGPLCTENSENWEEFLDKADIGDIGSELSHTIDGWSSENISGNYGGCGNGSCTYRQVLGEGEACVDNETNREATAVLHAGDNTIKNLVIRHLDGISKGDSFEVYVNDEKVGEWNDDSEISHEETWVVSFFDVSAIDISGDMTVKIYAKDSVWGGCSTYGQVSIDWIGINGCGTPYEEPEGSVTIYKYDDLDGDGEKDENEPFLPDWEVLITNPHYQYGGLEDPKTDSEGKFVFSNLQLGLYNVCEFIQEGWENTQPGYEPFEWGEKMAICYEDVIVGGDIDVYFGNKEILQEVECPQGTTAEFLETVTVPSNGNTVDSLNTLENGSTYLLEASGTYKFANWGNWGIADAEWSYRSSAYYPTDPAYTDVVPDPSGTSGWVKGEGFFASECGLDAQVNACVDWGDFNPDHIYRKLFPGTGAVASFYIYDNQYADNVGNLGIDIYECKLNPVCEPGETQACQADAVGICAQGTTTCDEQGQWGSCEPSEPIDEICSNDLDDDCDGTIDWQDADCQICDPQINLISNGGFETPAVIDPAGWDIFGDSQLAGWFVEWMPTIPEVVKPIIAYLELQRGIAGSPHGDEQLAELDSDWGGPSSEQSGEPASVKIYQNINTIPGRHYTVKFWYSPRPGRPIDDNLLEFNWNNGASTDTKSGIGGSTVDWVEGVYPDLVATSNNTRIQFSDLAASFWQNSYGPYLDDVSVVCQTNVCGDGFCDGEENCDGCPQDCSGCEPICQQVAEVCDDGIDNDCDGLIDCDDTDCSEADNCQAGPTGGGGGPIVASFASGGGNPGSGTGAGEVAGESTENEGEVLGESTTLPETGGPEVSLGWCLGLVGLFIAVCLFRKEILEKI